MSLRVVLIGRPNVGKSAIFNRLLRRRRSLVHGEPGMTRDVLEETVRLPDGRSYTLVDTGGFDPADREAIPSLVRQRALAEIARADLLLLVLDASAGVVPADREAARAALRSGRPCFALANKVDRRAGEEASHEAWELGFPEVFPVSAEHDIGFDALRDAIAERLPPAGESGAEEEAGGEEAAPREIAVAIVGRPNVGKSSLLNALVGYERAIVSELAGTTRDAVDAAAEISGRRVRFVDTAGIRRKAKTEKGPEVLSVVAAIKRLEACDVALLVFDASLGATSQDAAVASEAVKEGRGLILAANKWDAVADPAAAERFREETYRKLSFARFAPLHLVSAKTGRGVSKLASEIARVAENRSRRVATAMVNKVLGEAVRGRRIRTAGGKDLKIYYVSQTGVRPPTFTLVASRGEELYFSEARRLENVVRKMADFSGTPIRLHVAARRKSPRG